MQTVNNKKYKNKMKRQRSVRAEEGEREGGEE